MGRRGWPRFFPVGLWKGTGCLGGGGARGRGRGCEFAINVHGLGCGLVGHGGHFGRGEPAKLVGREVERVGVAVVSGRALGRVGARASFGSVALLDAVRLFVRRRGRGAWTTFCGGLAGGELGNLGRLGC